MALARPRSIICARARKRIRDYDWSRRYVSSMTFADSHKGSPREMCFLVVLFDLFNRCSAIFCMDAVFVEVKSSFGRAGLAEVFTMHLISPQSMSWRGPTRLKPSLMQRTSRIKVILDKCFLTIKNVLLL